MHNKLTELTRRSWPKFAQVAGLTISAGPLLHRCPTLGFQFQEAPHAAPVDDATIQKLHANAEALKADRGVRNPLSLLGTLVKQRSSITLPDGSVLDPPPFIAEGRRIVVLGDTLDATGGLDDADGARGMLALAADADVLVHEATNIALPPHLTDRKAAAIPAATSIEAEREATRAKALLRGHSTPQVAGSFAKRVGARQLILNHFSVRYGAPNRFAAAKKAGATSGVEDGGEANKGQTDRAAVMKEFEDQAVSWESGGEKAPDVADAELFRRRKPGNLKDRHAPLQLTTAWSTCCRLRLQLTGLKMTSRRLFGHQLRRRAAVEVEAGDIAVRVTTASRQPARRAHRTMSGPRALRAALRKATIDMGEDHVPALARQLEVESAESVLSRLPQSPLEQWSQSHTEQK